MGYAVCGGSEYTDPSKSKTRYRSISCANPGALKAGQFAPLSLRLQYIALRFCASLTL